MFFTFCYERLIHHPYAEGPFDNQDLSLSYPEGQCLCFLKNKLKL